LFGLLTVTRAVLPQMWAQRSGRIFNISSIGGCRADGGSAVYCSTKFAVERLSEALHAELAPLGNSSITKTNGDRWFDSVV
jgi:NADP-dependent 3-hydroxy acid dehydrogenase YdfG